MRKCPDARFYSLLLERVFLFRVRACLIKSYLSAPPKGARGSKWIKRDTHTHSGNFCGGSEGNGGGEGRCRRAGCRDTEARAAVVSLHPSSFFRLPPERGAWFYI